MSPTPPNGDTPAAAAIGPSTGRLPPGVSNPVDIHVGSRLRMRRTLLGISQGKLGAAVGLTFQQIQKYERGANRIGASRLYQFSEILDVPISYFFDEMPDKIRTREGAYAAGMREDAEDAIERDPMVKHETMVLVRNYYRITDPRVRRNVFELAKSLAKSGSGEEDGEN